MKDASGIHAHFYVGTPHDLQERPGTLREGLRREVWDGVGWVSYETPPEIGQLGFNSFRARWIFELAPDESTVTIPHEVEINPIFLDGSESQPHDGADYTDLKITVTDAYPIGNG